MNDKTEWIIGRADSCDIVIADPAVSSRHCRLRRLDGRSVLEDLGSANGTFVNGVRITSPRDVTQADEITLGLSTPLSWPPEMLTSSTPVQPPATEETGAPRTVLFRSEQIVLGRDPTCEHVLSFPMISRRHARLLKTPAGLVLEDLGSSNGTYLNGRRIFGSERLKSGDVITLGSYELRLNPDGLLEEHDLRGRLKLEARRMRVDVPGKRLIDDISLTILPGEFVGLMGPSGAGKTTLMSSLNGYLRPTSGDVLLNGQPLYGHYAQFAMRFGYVPQDDIMHRDLTVGEALYFTARLRLPRDYSREDIANRIRGVLEQLGLSGTENVLIGSPEKKGISGGQRKRVNLAMELLTDPLVLFLDEPTSGLSSEDALMVMKVLRSLADAGKTILLTIHQPSLEVFRLLDNLAIVSKDRGSTEPGRLVYYGPAYPAAADFFNPDRLRPAGVDVSPDEVLRGLAQKPSQEWHSKYQSSETCAQYVTRRASTAPARTQKHQVATSDGRGFWQWPILVRRNCVIKLRDKWNTGILLAQAPIVGLLIALIFGSRAGEKIESAESWLEVAETLPMALFILAFAALWFGCSNAVREIVGEWAVYRRERMVNLKIPAYVASKFLVLAALSSLQCLVLLAIVYPGCGLKGPPWLLFLGLLLVSLVGVNLGLNLSAVSQSSEAAVALLPIVLLPMVMLGGLMLPVHQMPKTMQRLANVMPSRWAFECVMLAESEERPLAESYPPKMPSLPNASPPNTNLPTTVTVTAAPHGDFAEKFFPKDEHRKGMSYSLKALAVMVVTLYCSVHLILRKRDLH